MKDDAILPITRGVAVVVAPFLWLAFLILFFLPDQTGERFAWAIKPHMTSLYIGAGYLGGSWLFLNTIFGRRWHRIQGGFWAITTFTWFMLFVTLLHWDRFSHGRLGFILWLILYIITPLLVPAIWFYNKRTDSGTLEESDLIVNSTIVWVTRLFGTIALVTTLTGFFLPEVLIHIWPWTLTPLTARVMSGWIALLGVGAFAMAADPRWSAWRVPIESIVIWHVLVIVAVLMNPADFTQDIWNWYTLAITVMLIWFLGFYPFMEIRRRRAAQLQSG